MLKETLGLSETRAAKGKLETRATKAEMVIRALKVRKEIPELKVLLAQLGRKEQKAIPEHRDPLALRVQPVLRDKKETKEKRVTKVVMVLAVP